MDNSLLFVVLSLTTYRFTRLVTRDTFPPILWLRDRLSGGWREATQTEVSAGSTPMQDQDGTLYLNVQRAKWAPQWVADLISCAWCSSGWVSMGVVGSYAIFSSLPDPLVMWPAVWGAGAILAAQDWA